jgi:hypothetical protein
LISEGALVDGHFCFDLGVAGVTRSRGMKLIS